MMLIPGTCIKSNNVVSFPSWRDSSASYSQWSGPDGLLTEQGLMAHQSFPWPHLIWHGLRERAPASLCLFQSVQDKLAGVDEALHTVNEAHFCSWVQLWPWFIHTFLLEADTDPLSEVQWTMQGISSSTDSLLQNENIFFISSAVFSSCGGVNLHCLGVSALVSAFLKYGGSSQHFGLFVKAPGRRLTNSRAVAQI